MIFVLQKALIQETLKGTYKLLLISHSKPLCPSEPQSNNSRLGDLQTWNYQSELTPSVIANAPEVEDAGRFSPSSPLDLGREPVDLRRKLPLVPGLAGER